LQSADPDALEDAEQRFAACGAHLVAAELADRAARALRERGLVRDAGRASRRAAGHRERCDGFAPATDDAAPALSEREREVAMLILEGLSSKEIATKLTVSVRTVSNHLQSIYLKLGISRRAELADALSLTG
jgi:DNA-binding NarL/FixJ family response regulator